MRQLNIGEEVELPDGRTVKFVECNIESMDDPCEGCAFEDEHCTSLNDFLVHVEAVEPMVSLEYLWKYLFNMDSLFNGDYTSETTEDYGDEICNLPYPGYMG